MFRGRLDQAPQQWRSECHLPGFFCLFFHPAILDLVSYILGTQDLRLYPNYTCRPKLPGRHMDEVLWHTDAGYTYFGPSADPSQADSRDASKLTESLVSRMAESMVNVWTPLVPVDAHNGCMQFSTGSHRLGLVHHEYRRELGGPDTREGLWLHVDERVLASHCSVESGRVVDIAVEPGDSE